MLKGCSIMENELTYFRIVCEQGPHAGSYYTIMAYNRVEAGAKAEELFGDDWSRLASTIPSPAKYKPLINLENSTAIATKTDKQSNFKPKTKWAQIWTWGHVDQALIALCNKLPNGSHLWGIPRGGTLIAVMMSHAVPTLIYESVLYADKTDIVVDDIVDTGESMSDFCNYETATLVERYSSKTHTDYVGVTVEHDDYIIFPWER